MSDDIFGNLREWGEAADQLRRLAESKKLGEHQEGLIRILRYRDNWRLREMVLECAKDLKTPSNGLVSAVLDILTDEGAYSEARILAAETLADLIARKGTEFADDRCTHVRRVVDKITAILDSPQPPVMHNAMRKSLAAIRNAE